MQTSSVSASSSNLLDRNAPFYVVGHRGLVGSAVVRYLESQGFTNIVFRTSNELNLLNRSEVFRYMREIQPRYLVLSAAKVGGILANMTYPVEFISENLQIQTNVLDAALECKVERLLFLGSSCIYPKFAGQPIVESSLLSGYLEPTNEPYAIAKIAGIVQVQAVRREYGLPWISAMPTNLYGPNDNFSPKESHVLPALIHRYEAAAAHGSSSVTNWGSGNPRRELMHSDDLAAACLFLLENYNEDEHVNVGTGVDFTIREIAEIVASKVGFKGETIWDTTKPDGTPRKLLDTSKISALGWQPQISLPDGVSSVLDWYRSIRPNLDQRS